MNIIYGLGSAGAGRVYLFADFIAAVIESEELTATITFDESYTVIL
jgi:hypothetical protein